MQELIAANGLIEQILITKSDQIVERKSDLSLNSIQKRVVKNVFYFIRLLEPHLSS